MDIEPSQNADNSQLNNRQDSYPLESGAQLPTGYEMSISRLMGKPIIRCNLPYAALIDTGLVDDRGVSTTLSDFLYDLAGTFNKVPANLRPILAEHIDFAKTANAPLEVPFMTSDGMFAVELFWGQRRYIVFTDPEHHSYVRMEEIPMATIASTDPECYIHALKK
jgi:hypothetical protein